MHMQGWEQQHYVHCQQQALRLQAAASSSKQQQAAAGAEEVKAAEYKLWVVLPQLALPNASFTAVPTVSTAPLVSSIIV